MVINCYGEYLFRFILPDYILIKVILNLIRTEKINLSCFCFYFFPCCCFCFCHIRFFWSKYTQVCLPSKNMLIYAAYLHAAFMSERPAPSKISEAR